MREFKFRGWHTVACSMIDLKKITPAALDANLNCDGVFLPFDKDIILMQYTGLKDKNDKEIYEGDILERVGSKDIFMNVDKFVYANPLTSTKEVVELKVSCNDFGMTTFGYSLDTQKTYSERTKPATYEVIGNIYQNPELLKPAE